MSERFEASINEWYSSSRIADLEYLNLEFPKAIYKTSTDNINFYCFHQKNQKHSSFSENPHLNYISDSIISLQQKSEFIFDRLSLFSRVSIKHFHKIQENQNKNDSQIRDILQTQAKITKNIHQLANEVEKHKPLTKAEVLSLVEQLAQQPKIVEAEALRLTENLNNKIKEVEKLLQEVKHVLTS